MINVNSLYFNFHCYVFLKLKRSFELKHHIYKMKEVDKTAKNLLFLTTKLLKYSASHNTNHVSIRYFDYKFHKHCVYGFHLPARKIRK